jgi:hypothetical protein
MRSGRPGGGVGVGDHRADVVSHEPDVLLEAELGQQPVHVGGEGLLVVAAGGRVALARAA